MRPRSLDEFVGQRHILGPRRLLRRCIEADRIASLIFFGPPGCGKSALARIIAQRSNSSFREINAVTSGVSDIRRIILEAKREKNISGRSTILFIDEIHRFNKAQQEALLPDVERGNVALIGVSTQNPFFAIIPALSSRSLLFEFRPLEDGEIRLLIDRALSDEERGFDNYRIKITEDAINHIITTSEGDARRALNALEVGVLTTSPNAEGDIIFDIEVAQESVQKKVLSYDNGDNHYDTISAFIKSMRGSDPDATLYWLAKMIYAGEDPLYIARRIVICASEDVGNADPMALNVAVSAFHALEVVGMPEGRIPLAQAAVYVACAPKSNASFLGLEKALEDVKDKRVLPVPIHLRDTHYKGATRLGHGKDYKYPHSYPSHYIPQQYMPERRSYYNPTEEGFEAKIKQRLEKLLKVLYKEEN